MSKLLHESAAPAAITPPRAGESAFSDSSVLASLPLAVVTLGPNLQVRSVNAAAEQLFAAGANTLTGLRLQQLLAPDSPVVALVEQVRAQGSSVSQSNVVIASARIGWRLVSVTAAPLGDDGDGYVLSLHEQTMARRIERQLTHRGAARSVSGMAALLAHEVKNPLSGIRGAAQLLERNASEKDRDLTRLICDEADRIVALVDRMGAFAESRPLERQAVNIHKVLEHVRRLAQSGFASHLRFIEAYDTSLPPAFANRDLLVQALLNLIKNAAEAAPANDGEIKLATAYRHGMRVSQAGGAATVDLPLEITVQDNGVGIAEDVRAHLFDPFVTTKPSGSGLGLALVAKIVSDHGGVIDVESRPRRTTFRIMLPLHTPSASEPA